MNTQLSNLPIDLTRIERGILTNDLFGGEYAFVMPDSGGKLVFIHRNEMRSLAVRSDGTGISFLPSETRLKLSARSPIAFLRLSGNPISPLYTKTFAWCSYNYYKKRLAELEEIRHEITLAANVVEAKSEIAPTMPTRVVPPARPARPSGVSAYKWRKANPLPT